MRNSTPALFMTLAIATMGATPVSQTTIHPGDQLNVQVYGDKDLTQTVTVLPDGSIIYPLIGRVQVGGQSVNDATTTVRTKLQKYVRNPFVTIEIQQLGQPSVLVLGDVKTPGKYQLRSDARVTDAIAAAGGIVDVNGPMPDARVSNPQGDVSTVSLQKLLHDGQTALDKPVGEGYVVYVPGPTLFNITVTGAVDKPGDVQIAEGDHLSEAIAKAGNSANANADLNNIRVIRTNPDGTRSEQTIDLYKALERGDSSADISMQKGDVVYVPQAKRHSDVAGSPLLYLLGRLIIP